MNLLAKLAVIWKVLTTPPRTRYYKVKNDYGRYLCVSPADLGWDWYPHAQYAVGFSGFEAFANSAELKWLIEHDQKYHLVAEYTYHIVHEAKEFVP